MVIFHDDPALPTVETVSPRSDESEGEELSDTDTVASISELVGAGDDLPAWCFFGKEECRVIFSLPSDKSGLVRVCGQRNLRTRMRTYRDVFNNDPSNDCGQFWVY